MVEAVESIAAAAEGHETFWPDLTSFQKAYDSGQSQLVWTRLVADLETPVSAYLKLSDGAGVNSFLFESVEGGAVRGRYSVIGLKPDLIFRNFGDRAEINEAVLDGGDAFTPLEAPTLTAACGNCWRVRGLRCRRCCRRCQPVCLAIWAMTRCG